MKSHRGMTLVEVMVAGSLTVLFSLALMEGLIVATKISHENAQLLAAEAYAWDTAWRYLNTSYSKLNGSTSPRWYPDRSGREISSNDCPQLCRELAGAPARLYVRVSLNANDTAVARHGVNETESKLIEVDVEWGPPDSRMRLNTLASASARSFNIPVSVSKCSIERGAEE